MEEHETEIAEDKKSTQEMGEPMALVQGWMGRDSGGKW